MFQETSMTNSVSRSGEAKKKKSSIVKMQLTLTIHPAMNASHLVQLLGLWSSRSWSTVTLYKGGLADPLPMSAVLFSSTVTKSSKEAVADPTWVQSAIATRYGMFCTWVQSTIATIHRVC